MLINVAHKCCSFFHFIKNETQQQDKKVIRTPKKWMIDQISKGPKDKKIVTFYPICKYSRAKVESV